MTRAGTEEKRLQARPWGWSPWFSLVARVATTIMETCAVHGAETEGRLPLVRLDEQKTIGLHVSASSRFFMATTLTPLVMMMWLGLAVDTVLGHFGAHPDGPAGIGLAMMIIMLGFGVPLACLLLAGLPYALIMRSQGWLNLWTIILPSCLVAIAYSFLIYSSMYPDRYPAVASVTALATAPGVLVASLCFYVVGVWGNTPADRCG